MTTAAGSTEDDVGNKNLAPPPPDLTPVANAYKDAAAHSFQLGQDQLNWAKEQYASTKATTDKVVDSLLNSQAKTDQRADEYYKRYKDVYEPAQDRYLSDAENYDSAGRRDQNVGQAQAAVAQNFDAARQAATRQLEGFGVNPGATRYAALDAGTRVAEAAAKAAAGTQAARDTEATGLTLRANAINMGNGLPGQSATSSGVSTGAGTGATGSENQTFSTGSGAMTAPSAYTGQGVSAIGGWGQTLNNGYSNALDAFKANNSASSGWGSLLGAAAGIGAKMYGFAEGGAVPPQDGGAIPMSASPSGGVQTDDIPARLNAGEFILPKDVVSWIGEKNLQATIQKARKEKEGAQAKPAIGAAPAQAPAVRTAIPMGAAA